MRRACAVVLVLSVLSVAAHAQAPQKKSEADIKAEAATARALYEKNNFVGALPLYEDLYAQVPASLVYEEALAMCLLSKDGTPAEEKAAHVRSKKLLLDAQSKGDNSPLLKTLLEKMGDGDGYTAPSGPQSPAALDFAAAEKHFGAGELKQALELYQKALAEQPKFYEAALYAGDTLFKMGDCAQANTYYAKAIAIDPDRETAHRYEGDCLEKIGEHQHAEAEYIQAVLAQPYSQTTRSKLAEWAKVNHDIVLSPAIKLPAAPSPTKGGKKGDVNITIDASKKSDESAGDLAYSMSRTVWQWQDFKKNYPNEKEYRHSLKEEAESIRAMLSVPPKKPNESVKALQALEKDGMLECWILLDDADQGIAQDYLAYRKDHRDLMAQYIAKYDVHPM